MEGQNKSSEGIRVAIRMRPLNERETNGGQEKIFRCQTEYNAVTQVRDGQPIEGQTSYFDKVFHEKTLNRDVYSYLGKEIVQGVMAGINGTIFAYGQTSSGKTHTMLGSTEEKGVVYMAAEDIFAHISSTMNRDFLLRASFVEIYNENIRDLLSDSQDSLVSIREDPRRGVYCEAVECVITDFDSILKLLKKGIGRRAVEATAMNETSSRSHTIFRLVVESRESQRPGVETDGAVLVSALNLVDLAGSESVRHTGAMGQRAKEGGKINQSLLSLSRVIHSLSQPGAHVNFRDSKLTRLLQPSLCGNAKMSIVCCITPAQAYLEETRSTLAFASRAKLVVTNAKVNEVLDESSQIRRLKKELEALKELYRSHGDGVDVQQLLSEKAQLQQQVLSLQQQLQSKDSAEEIDSDAETVPDDEMAEIAEGAGNMAEAAEPTAIVSTSSLPEALDEAVAQSPSDKTGKRKRNGRKRQRRTWSAFEAEDRENVPANVDITSLVTAREGEPNLGEDLLVSLQQQVSAGQVRMDMLAVENTNLKDELDSKSTKLMLDREFELMEQNAALKEESSRQAATIEELTSELASLREDLVAVKLAAAGQEKVREEAEATQRSESAAFVGTLETQLAESRAQVSSLEVQVQGLQSDLAAAAAELTSAKEKENSLLVDLEDEREKSADFALQIEDTKREIAHNKTILDAALQAAQSARDRAEDELNAANSKAATLVAHVQALQQEILQVRTMLTQQDLVHESWQTREADFERSTAALQEEVAQLQRTIEQLETDLEQQQQTGSTFEARVNELQEALNDSVQALAAAEFRQSELDQELSQLRQRQVDEDNARASHSDEVELVLQRASQEVQTLREEVDSLTSRLRESEETLRVEQEASASRLEAAEHSFAAVECAVKESAAREAMLQAELDQRVKEAEALGARQKDLENALTTTQLSVEEALQREIALEEELASLQEQRDRQSARLAEQQTQCDAMQLQLSSAPQQEASEQELALSRSQLATSERELESARFELESTRSKLELACSELDSTRSELESTRSELESARSELESTRSQIEATRSELESTRSELETTRSEMESTRSELEATRSELEATRSEMDAIVARENLLRQELAELKEELIQSVQQVADQKERMQAETDALLQEAHGQLMIAQQETAQVEQALAAAKQHIQSLEARDVVAQSSTLARLAEMELSQSSLDAARREMQVSMESLHNELMSKEAEYSKVLNQNLELRAQLKATEEELKRMRTESSALSDGDVATRKRLAQTQTELDILKGEKEGLLQKLKALEGSLAAAERAQALGDERAQQAVSAAERALQAAEASASDRIRALEYSLACARDETSKLQQQSLAANKEMELLQKRLVAAEECVERLQGEDSAALREALADVTKARDEALADVASLKAHQNRIREEQSLLRSELEDMQGERDNALLELESAAQRMQELTTALEESEQLDADAIAQERDSLRQQLEELETQYVELSAAVQQLETDLQAKDEEVRAATLECRDAEEARVALLGRVRETEERVQVLEQSLAEHDKNASKEQDALMAAAEMQMDLLRSQIEDGVARADKLLKEKEALQQSEESLLIKVDKLLTTLQDREDQLRVKDAELRESEAAAMRSSQASSAVEALERGLSDAQREVVRLQQTVVEKDARIAHLDACKLTKDQMEKIKVMKEERKKYMDGYKTMKKQLASLKEAYDELKAAATISVGAPSQEFVISDLKFQVAEVNGQLSRSLEINALLKDKLKECSDQLEVYEKERDGVLQILDKHGIDVRGLQMAEMSALSSDLAGSSGAQTADLGEAVGQMAQKIIEAQAAASARSTTASSELQQAQTQMQALLAETAEAAAQKAAVEKRLEAAKLAARELREENAALTGEIGELRLQLQTMSAQVQEAQKKLLTGAETSSSEVQVLEEENLELMRENKELRLELAKLRSQASVASVAAVATAPIAAIPAIPAIPVIPAVSSAPVLASSSGVKRSFGTDLPCESNQVIPATPLPAGAAAPAPVKSASKTVTGLGGSSGDVVDKENAQPATGTATKVVRRVKAKPSAPPAAGAEAPAECTQS